MRADYRWILEQTFKHVGLDEDKERHFRDILLEAEGQFPQPVLSERPEENPQDSIYEKELERCTEILGMHWEAACGCNGLLCVAEHLDNILKTLKEQRGKVLLPLTLDTEALRAQIMPLLIRQIEEYQKKLEEQAINIILHQEGPISTFIEIENDGGAGVGVGEYLPQRDKYNKLRITAANIINLKDVL